MSYPENPNTIILKNRIYPSGLKEIDIWNYYQKYKHPMLDETKSRDLMFFIMADINKPIIRRRLKTGTIRLTPQNYDTLITGRTISIHSAMKSIEEFGIIDVDIDPHDGFKWAKKVTSNVYDFVMDKMPLVTNASIRFTGKNSFHIICNFRQKMKIDTIRFLLRKFLRNSDLSKAYTIEGRRRAGIPNLDLAPNKLRGNYITLNSLSVLGLRCMKVDYRDLPNFDPRRARI